MACSGFPVQNKKDEATLYFWENTMIIWPGPSVASRAVEIVLSDYFSRVA